MVRAELRWGALGDVDLAGREVTEVTAYGKHILTRIARVPDPGRPPARNAAPPEALTLRSHLKMEGRWSVYRSGARPWPAAHQAQVRAVLAGVEWTAVATRLGLLDLIPTAREATLIGHLGPDILADDFPTAGAPVAGARLAADPTRHIGAALLDQTVVAGIGTMYMAETLFLQRVSPWAPVSAADPEAVLATARRLLLRGVAQAVPTTTGDSRRGLTTFVHGRSGLPCRRCGTTVRVAQIGPLGKERTAFYCPTCQPGPTPTDDGRPQSPLGAGRRPVKGGGDRRR